jgi:hypothetical protein
MSHFVMNMTKNLRNFNHERNGGSICLTMKKGKSGGFYFGFWEFLSPSYWCCSYCVGAPEAVLKTNETNAPEVGQQQARRPMYRKKTMNSSTKDKAEGKMHQVKNKIRETGGKAVIYETISIYPEGYINFIAHSCGELDPR